MEGKELDAFSVWEDGKFQRWLVVLGAEQYECIGHHRPLHLKMIARVFLQLKKIADTTK